MSGSAYAPFNTSYGQRKPYITTTEFLNAPTAVDVANLIPSGSAQQQTAALGEVIGRASSLLDSFIHGAWGTLSATVDTENARVYGSRDGTFIVHPKYWPVLEVRSFQYGLTPGFSSSIDPASSMWIEPTQFVVQPSGIVGLGLTGLANVIPRQRYMCQWTYVNGWPNALLSASVSAAATSISLDDVTGVYPGSSLTIFDATNDETITVASNYTIGSSTVPLTAPLGFGHASGTRVSNAPNALREAAILMTTVLVKVRGSGALVVNNIGEVARQAANAGQGAVNDFDLAMHCINSLRQMYVGY